MYMTLISLDPMAQATLDSPTVAIPENLDHPLQDNYGLYMIYRYNEMETAMVNGVDPGLSGETGEILQNGGGL